jgi:hypothetical protein
VKRELGWLEDADIRRHDGASTEYALQHLSLPMPPQQGRAAAVQIGTEPPYLMIESRQMTDQFEGGMPSLPRELAEYGIDSRGVIAYRVQTPNPTVQERPGGRKPLYLNTVKALQVGQSAGLDNGITLTVTAALPDGFQIRVEDPGRHVLDRTAATSARSAAGVPTAIVLPGSADRRPGLPRHRRSSRRDLEGPHRLGDDRPHGERGRSRGVLGPVVLLRPRGESGGPRVPRW